MHIGLIGGIGPAATISYYRHLVQSHAEANRHLHLTIVQADVREMTANLEAGAAEAQAAIFASHIDQLRAGGCDFAAITSIGGHFCIDALRPVATLPIVSAVAALDAHLAGLSIGRVGVLGTRAVMQSGLYGIASTEVIAPPHDELAAVHREYVSMAIAGAATPDQCRLVRAAGLGLCERGAELVVLGGTDLSLAFGDEDPGYRVLNTALVHAEAIARLAMAG